MQPMKKKPPPLTEQLRQAILTSGQSRYAIAKATGIDAATLCRFMAGKGLSMEALDTLVQYLDLELRKRRPTRERGK